MKSILRKGREVEYSLRDLNKPIGVSDFSFTETLPEQLAKSIPTIAEFEQELGNLNKIIRPYEPIL